jgi:hypothetical protein
MTSPNLPRKFSNFVVFKTAEGELQEELVCLKFRHTTDHGAIEGKTQQKEFKGMAYV